MTGRAWDQGDHPIDSVPGTVIYATDYLSQLAKLVVRGFIPAGLRSDPKILRLLRSRTGINPLTTSFVSCYRLFDGLTVSNFPESHFSFQDQTRPCNRRPTTSIKSQPSRSEVTNTRASSL